MAAPTRTRPCSPAGHGARAAFAGTMGRLGVAWLSNALLLDRLRS